MRWNAWLPAFVLGVMPLGMACDEPTADELLAQAEACEPSERIGLAGREGLWLLVNAYYLQDEAAAELKSGAEESGVVEETFAKASALGVQVVRTWAFSDGTAKATALQPRPLEYDEVSMRALDGVLARAQAHGLKLILVLGNYWDAYGGARQYVTWAGLEAPVEGDSRFFTEPRVVDHYRTHVANLLNRVSSIDGIRYGEHPAVLAWELLNEPRNIGLDPRGDALRAWVDSVAGQVKQLAPGHAVGLGEEGFDASAEAYDASYWAKAAPQLFAGSGQFRRNLESPAIDFASIHYFPETWGVRSIDVAEAGARWIREHARVAREVGKPLILGEFGLKNSGFFSLEKRRAMYRGWLRCAKASGLAAAGPWMFANDARPDEWDAHTFYFRDGTQPDDPMNRYADLLVEAAAP
jgi:mannan endo-1,4-beta-mannosidase